MQTVEALSCSAESVGSETAILLQSGLLVLASVTTLWRILADSLK